MAQSLYEVLGLSNTAPQELVDESYRILAKKLEERAGHDEEARNRLVAAKEAYRTLGDPERRARYDAYIAAPAEPAYAGTAPASRPLRGYDAEESRWKAWVIGAVVLALLAFAGQRYYATHVEAGVTRDGDRQRNEVDRLRVDNERRMIDGTLGIQADQIANRAQIENRRLGIQENAEQRYSRESDDRYRIQQQQLELQRQRQDAQRDAELARQNYRIAAEQRAEEERAAAREQARLDRLNRYNACVSSGLVQYGYDGARQRCLAYQ